MDWIEKADIFLEDAEKHLAEGHFWLACFESHQAAEFYLKSLLVAITGFHPYTHDLSELLDALIGVGFNSNEEIKIASEILTPHYTLSRYPGKRAISYTKERAERCLRSAKLIVGWVKEVADP
ncbi:MAG: HEPN domain-containing protein [Candidatus Korarchaeum sp.]|nr:HEPN domain-containing protein [Candidatus Korarchaeum sp.]MDW8036037.1 HEPN domain-containing protein [Candidatus Korarchaeum sp.]